MRRDIEAKPVQQLGDLLDLIGVRLVLDSVIKSKGIKRRGYRLDVARLIELMDVVARRVEKRQEVWEAKKADARGDNRPMEDSYDQWLQLSPDWDREDGETGDHSTTSLESAVNDAKAGYVERKTARALKVFSLRHPGFKFPSI